MIPISAIIIIALGVLICAYLIIRMWASENKTDLVGMEDTKMETTYNNKTVGDYEVSNQGIARIISVDGMGGYTSTLVMSKEAFIEAYNKYIVAESEEEV